jgi:hypothetical protein
MTVLRREQLLGVALSACLCLVVGATVAINWQVSIALVALALGLSAAAAPASAWVGASLTAALLFKGIVSLGLMPSISTFLDIPLAWGALGVASNAKG